MKIKSEKQFSKLYEPSAEGGFSRLPFDPEKYRKYLAETGWSEKRTSNRRNVHKSLKKTGKRRRI